MSSAAGDVPASSIPPTGRPRGASLAEVRTSFEQIREQGQLEEAIEFLLAAYGAVLDTNQELALLVARLRRTGHRSERTDPGQLTLLMEQLLGGQSAQAVINQLEEEISGAADADVEREIAAAEAAQKTARPPTRRAVREWVTSEQVRREVHEMDVAQELRRCDRCGGECQRIGTDVTHRLELVPAQFVEKEYRLAKYACPTCKEGVRSAPAPPQVLERSAAGASLLTDIVVSKYVDHCPLTRLHRIYRRDGVALPVSTMSDWVAGIAELVTPLVERLAARVHQAWLVRTDATGLKVLSPAHPAHIEMGTMWCYVGDDRDVVFRYTPTGEGATGPWRFLAGRTGYVQADAASVFDRLFTGAVASAVEVGCWAHARRDYVALLDTDARVAYPLKLIGRLYRIERLADLQQRSVERRLALRRERSTILLTKLKRWLVATLSEEPPSSAFAKAGRYILNHWTALTRFLEDGRLGLDNNLCEQQLRSIALGRRNYLFAGSHAAAEHTATLYSLMRTCALRGVPPLPYLAGILPVLATSAGESELDALLPDRWSERNVA